MKNCHVSFSSVSFYGITYNGHFETAEKRIIGGQNEKKNYSSYDGSSNVYVSCGMRWLQHQHHRK